MKAPSDDSAAAAPSRLRWKLGLIALVVALAVLAGAIKPAQHYLQRRRAARYAAAAERLFQASQFAEAGVQATAALELVPDNVTALRVMAQTLSRQSNASALQFWADLVHTGAATDDERRNYIQQALQAGLTEAAGRELQQLLRAAPDRPANLWLAAQWFLQIHNRAQALEYAAFAALGDPTNREYKLFLSRLQFDAQDDSQRSTARGIVWARARETNSLALEALTFLAQRPNLAPPEKQEVVTLLQQHPAHSFGHELLALTLELTIHPAQRPELIQQAIARYHNASPENRVRFISWLARNGETARIPTALPAEEALPRKDYFMLYLDALAALKRWEEILKVLEAPQLPVETAYAEAFRARSESELQHPDRAEPRWAAALAAAGRSSEQLLWLARFAEGSGALDTTRHTLRTLIKSVENPLPAYRELEQFLTRQGTTLELRDLLAEMSARWPADPTFQNDTAYLNLLLNREVETATRTARQLVAQHAEELPLRTTLALALYRQRDFKGALQAYEGRKFPWHLALANQRAVYAAVLEANGNSNEARQMMVNLNFEQLRPEEQELVRKVGQ